MELPASIDDEETVLVVLGGLRDFCAAKGLRPIHRIIEDCLKRCQYLYVERRRREFRDRDANATQQGSTAKLSQYSPSTDQKGATMVDNPAEEGTPEKVIAALKFLVFQCGSHGLPDYGQIIEDAAEECLKLMLNKASEPSPDVLRPH